jgi:hypothetical protein
MSPSLTSVLFAFFVISTIVQLLPSREEKRWVGVEMKKSKKKQEKARKSKKKEEEWEGRKEGLSF